MRKLFLLILLLGGLASTQAQNYSMSNQLVTDCNGTISDSNAGDGLATPSFYGHNEDYTFTICPSGADSIVLNFSSFCSELGLDILTFHDGPSIASPILGIPYSGLVTIPSIIATSGCLTLHFESDASVACEGWNASWETVINVPNNPVFAPIPNPNCNTTSLVFSLDQNFACGSLNLSNINIFGPSNPVVSNVQALNCNNGLSNTIQIDLAAPLSSNGNYSVQFSNDFIDDCGNSWNLDAFGSFAISNCPISVIIEADDAEICFGTCTDLEAIAWGGNGNYSFTWSNGLGTGAGPKQVCPLVTSTYTVTVVDGSNAPAGQAQITVEVIPQAVLPADFTVCQSDPNINLDAVPNTGYWTAPCIGNDTILGIFHPAWCGTGIKKVYYHYGTCLDSMNITITPMSVGNTNQLVCPTTPAFNIFTNNPGGVWTGPGITNTALGTFDPSLVGPGVYNINYSKAPCADLTKIITVGTPTLPADDTLCLNHPLFTPNFSPQGGTWTGPGVTNSYWCRFNASIAGPGLHNLIYTFGACTDTLKIYVQEIDAGSNLVVCPSQSAFNLVGLPAGGIWSGSGIVDPNLGIFYPQFNGGNNFSVWLSYTFNSCVDSVRIQGIQTKIVPDTLPSFCNYDAPYSLNFDETGRTPGGGIWSGNGITNSNANGVFTPSVASEGYSWLYYTANSCPDSVLIEIYPLPNLQDTTICIEQSAFIIPSDVLGGIWSGPGIVNPTNGTFLASLAGIGTHTIIYQTPHDCYYALQVTVDTLPIISLSGLPNLSCLVDTNYVIQASPLGGIWSGAVSDSLLNPLTLGTGVHTVQYTYGLGDCAVSSSISIQVLDTLKMLSFFEDTIVCPGTYVRVGATASGGDFLHYQFQWEDGFGGSSEILVQVDSNQQYILNLEDGCSEGVKDTFQVNVYPSFEVSIETSDSLCFGTEGWIKAAVLPNASYSFIWDNNPQFSLDSILGEAGSFYDLEITDNASFCKKNFSIQIPSFTAIMADFLTIPQDECLDLLHPELYIIDQSIGGLSGIWSFGDGSSQEYVPNANVYHEYLDTGIYQLVLQIENEGSCVSEHEWQVCVVPKTLIIAPTAFSPNLDGANDEFIVRTIGATKLVLQIYDRWGNLVYKTDDLRNHWDGNYKGDKQAVGTYAWTLQYYSLEEQKENIAKGSFQLIR